MQLNGKHQKVQRYFPGLIKEGPNFPLMAEIKEFIEEEWDKLDKRANLQNKFTKLYLFRSSYLSLWVTLLLIDAAPQRLARHVSLSLESFVTFKDPMDCKEDFDLK